MLGTPFASRFLLLEKNSEESKFAVGDRDGGAEDDWVDSYIVVALVPPNDNVNVQLDKITSFIKHRTQ